MSVPFLAWSQTYLKSVDVMGCPSDQTASGLILYVTFCFGVASNVGSPLSRTLGSYSPSGFTSKARGTVCCWIM